MALLVAAACNGSTPTRPNPLTQPSPPAPAGPRPTNTVDVEVTGIVTDERGAPLPGAAVTMAHYVGELVHWPSVQTDASGSYRIGFTGTPLGNGFVARAQVVADGYEEYWRSLKHGEAANAQNFRLYRLTRIVAGESTLLTVQPDLGECRSWMALACGVVRITIPKPGRLTVEVVSNESSTEKPLLEICCESGNEVHGNPVSVNVTPGSEFVLLVGLGQGVSTTRSFVVKTTLEAF